jgi:transcription antitermination protein NusB
MSQSQARTFARRNAVQALYQWQLTGFDLSEIERQFVEEHGLGKAERDYFNDLLHSIPQRLDEVDSPLKEFLDRAIAEVDPVERAILRIGSYELQFRPDVPYRVILNEGINLAKSFGASQSHKYVNGILDKLAKRFRSVEIDASRSGRL